MTAAVITVNLPNSGTVTMRVNAIKALIEIPNYGTKIILTTKEVVVTNTPAQVVALMGTPVVQLTVWYERNAPLVVGSVRYYPLEVINTYNVFEGGPYNRNALIQTEVDLHSYDTGKEVNELVYVTQTVANITTAFNNDLPVTTLALNGGTAVNRDVNLAVVEGITVNGGAVQRGLVAITSSAIVPKSAVLNWSNDTLDSVGTNDYIAYLFNVGTTKTNKTINIANGLINTGFQVLEVYFNEVVTELTVGTVGYGGLLVNTAVLATPANTLTINTVKAVRIQYAPSYLGPVVILVTKLA
jgi:hypothetical protein